MEEKLFKIKHEISNRQSRQIRNDIEKTFIKNRKIICKWLNKRFVFIDDYLNCIGTMNDKNYRIRSFYSWLELIKNVTKENITSIKN